MDFAMRKIEMDSLELLGNYNIQKHIFIVIDWCHQSIIVFQSSAYFECIKPRYNYQYMLND